MGTGATSSQEFAAVRKRLEDLSSAVLEQARSMRSVFGIGGAAQVDLLSRIIIRDKEVDSLELSLDDLTMAFMNFRAPLGRDLRFVIGAIDVAAALERVGDCIEVIARNLRDVGDLSETNLALWAVLKELSEKSTMILEKATAALLSGDAEAARAIPALDNMVDALQDKGHALVVEELRGAAVAAKQALDPEIALLVIATVNKFESVADIACHVAETAVYIVEGQRIRHGNKGFRDVKDVKDSE